MSKKRVSGVNFVSTGTTPSSGAGTLYVDDGTNTGTSEVKMRMNRAGTYVDTVNEPQIAIIVDEKGPTTDGGGFTVGSATTRVLNTVTSSQPWLSLSSNRFTIDGATYPGDYEILWYTPMFAVSRFYSFLVEDPAGSATKVMFGESGYTPSADTQTNSSGKYFVSLSASTVYEIRSQGTATKTVDGLGVAHNIAGINTIYTQVIIKRYW